MSNWRTFTNATTIPQYFKENGYTSIGMGKIFHPGPPNGNDDSKYSWSLPYFHGENTVRNPDCWLSFENISDSDLRDGQTTDKAVETIKQNRTKGDNTYFFLATGFHKPHLPFFAPSRLQHVLCTWRNCPAQKSWCSYWHSPHCMVNLLRDS